MSNVISGLSSENSETIGFVLSCVFASAIDVSELRAWCVYVIDQNDVESIPPYVFDLMDFDQPLVHLYKVIGFAPVWKHSDDEAGALYGIAAQRGKVIYDAVVNSEAALELLKSNPLIADKFRQTFPFLNLPAPSN